MRIVHNQHFKHKACIMPVCLEKCSTSEICCKCLIDGRFEKFKLNIQANTLPAKTIADQAYFNLDNSCKAINSLKNHILYCFNRVKGKCISIIYQFDCRVLSNRLQSDIFCNIKRIHFTECKYGNLQSVNCKSFNGRV